MASWAAYHVGTTANGTIVIGFELDRMDFLRGPDSGLRHAGDAADRLHSSSVA